MNYLRHILRFYAVQQLLPALESREEALIGGQAVLEGVMMRSPHAWGIAVRTPDGKMATHCETLERPSEKRKWLGWPLVRGLVTLGQAMNLGYRALRFSADTITSAMRKADLATESANRLQSSGQTQPLAPAEPLDGSEKQGTGNWLIAVNMVVSIGFFIFMYKLVPLAAATQIRKIWPVLANNFAFNLVDGIIRLALFVLFIWGISLWSDIRRVFEYHGAEHKTVFAYEAQREIPSIAYTQQFSTYHPRCGTSFLMTIMVISIFVYAAFPVTAFWSRFALRVLLLPVIASFSYEMIRFSAKHGKSLFALLTRPGLWLQRITTQPPQDDQVECAIKALDEAMALEKQHGGELVIA